MMHTLHSNAVDPILRSAVQTQSIRLESSDISWRCTPHQWHKLTSDGAFLERLGTAGADAILRDEQGGFKGELRLPICFGMILLVKLQVMKFGFELAIKLQVSKLFVKTDS